MAALTVTSIKKAGIADIDASLAAADVAGDSVDAASGIFIVMKNADASPHTLTILKPSADVECGNVGLAVLSDITLIVAVADTGFVSVPLGYANASGNFAWTYDDVTSVTIGVFSIAP